VVQQQRVAVGVRLGHLGGAQRAPAPPTFSISTVWLLSPLRNTSPRSRATLSVGPPAEKGTTMVTARSG